MTLQSSGQISLNDVNVELGNSGTATINMNSSDVRDLFGISSGQISLSDGYGKSSVAWYGDRGIFAGAANKISYFSIGTLGNASDFGDLTVRRWSHAGVSDGSRCCFGGGFDYGPFPVSNLGLTTIDYITSSTTGNASDFGDLSSARGVYSGGIAGLSDGSRGVFAGGQRRGGYREFTYNMDYITIASTGNAADFGDLLPNSPSNEYWNNQAGACNGTRGVFGGGGHYGATNIIQYITVQSTGNATDFGDLTVARGYAFACTGGDRACFGGGYDDDGANDSIRNKDVIDYIAMSTTGNATDFGDMTSSGRWSASCSDNSRGVWTGANGNQMIYITISTTGNAADFGDMDTSDTSGMTGTSGSSS